MNNIDDRGILICHYCQEASGIKMQDLKTKAEKVPCKKCGKSLINILKHFEGK